MKHPIIIPHNHRLTQLLILEAHQLTYHGGPRLTLSNLRRKYWVIGGNRDTKKELRNCIICRKNNPEIKYQLMGDLPGSRTDPAPPFYHTGVDYTGFVEVKANKGRGIKTTKGYIAVFICMVTKAVHLEIVSDLSSESFLAALRRMAARKSAPHHIYSDNGSNFVKANRIIKEEYQELEKVFNDQFYKEITNMNITWHFNAPSWPSAGGLWERSVRSLKYHLKRTIGEQKLTFEEYSTLVSQIEACLNSRPLCSISEDVEDLDFLTPAHFLSGRADLTVIDTDHDARTRWHLVKKLQQDIWKRWKTEYLSQLSARSKWFKRQENIKIGDVVIIKDDNLPAGKWAMGRVTEVHPGHDGLIRVVTLKTKNGFMKRPVAKLSILPLQPTKEQPAYHNENENTEQSNSKGIKSISKCNKFITMAITFILFMTIISPTSALYNLTKFNNSQSMYFDYISDLQIIRNEWTMIVYYNMSPYWEGMTTTNKFNNYLEKTCERFHEQTQCHMILQQLRHDQSELQYYNQLLLNQEFDAHARQRRGLINGIGYVANTLFGVLDERFAEKYKHDIQQIKVNHNHLAALLKNQTSVVEAEYNFLKRTEELISKQHKTVNKHLNILYQSTNYMKEQIQKLSSMEEFTLSAITATNIVNNLKRAQDMLLDTLTDIYHGKLNIHLITPKQLRSELQTISSHLSKDLTIPIKNIYSELQGIYHLLKVRARMTQDYFIFEIKFPLISRDSYQLYNSIPIPHQIDNNNMISVIQISDYIAINLQKDCYLTTTHNELQDCLTHEDRYLCKLRNPVRHLSANEKFCEIDQKINNCRVQKKTCENQLIKLANDFYYLYFYCNTYLWRIICGDVVSHQKVKGAGILHFSEKCMVKGEDFTIFSHQPSSNTLHITSEIVIPKIPQINYILNLSFPKLTTDSSEQKDLNNSLYHIQTQIRVMKENADKTYSNVDISGHDLHQYVISYGMLAAAVVLGGLVWWRRRKHRVVFPAPTTATAPARTHAPVIQQSDRSEENTYIKMVDMATSPITKKCVRFVEFDEETKV